MIEKIYEKFESAEVCIEEMIMNDYEDIGSNDNRIDKNHVSNTSHQELNEERELSKQLSDTDIKEEPKSYTAPLEDPNNSDKVVTIEEEEDDKTDTGGHVCKICQTVLKNRGGLMTHYNIHAGKFKCHRCKAPFSAKRELDNHISTCELQHVSCHKLQKIRAYAKLRPRQVPSLKRMDRFSSKFK